MTRSASFTSHPTGAGPLLNKHQQKTELTRRKLLKAARRVFARDGFEAARIEDIAAEAGHTRGAFYANFSSKEDLFFALLEHQAREHIANIQRTLDECESPEQRLESLKEYYVSRIADRQWVMLTLEFKLFALRHGQLRARLADTHRRIRSTLKGDLEKHLPSKLCGFLQSEDVCRGALEGILSGLVLEHAYDPKRLSEQDVVSLLRRIFDMVTQPSEPRP